MHQIRQAGTTDGAAIAQLHIDSWQAAYRDILPTAYLDDEIYRERPAAWAKTLAEEAGKNLVLVAEAERRSQDLVHGAIQGVIAVRLGLNDGFDAFLDNLHVHPTCRGQGLGKILIAAAVRDLMALGLSSLYLWVYDQNAGAIRLYEKLGGQKGEQGFDDFGGAHAPHTQYCWPDISKLLAACRE
ncbi:MAG: GNAT family N-acetyltransferase [Pseudomonadota bacterium]